MAAEIFTAIHASPAPGVRARDPQTSPSRLVVALLLASIAGGAAAQTTLTPGAVLETVRPPAPPPPAAQEGPALLPAATEAMPSLDPDAPRFPVTAFRITGNAAIATETLDALLAPHAGKQYNLFELNKLLQELTAHYRSAGYPVARAVLPAQKVEGGVVLIEIIEGKVDRVRFTGNARYRDAFLAGWSEPLVGETVRLAVLEQRLLLIDDLPGLETRAVLSRGQQYGTTSVEVQVEERPVEGSITVNNHGRREVGEHRVDAAVNLNNPLRMGDQLGVRASVSEDELLKLYGVSYSLPLGTAGTRLAASYTKVEYRLTGDELDRLELTGESELGSLVVSHPVLRSRSENLFATVGARTFHGKQLAFGQPLIDNDVTLAELGLAWNRLGDKNLSIAGLRVSSNGRDSRDGTRDNAHRFKIDGEFTHLRQVAARWEAKLATAAVWSPDSLADAERFSLGGPSSVRGYPSASVLGDRGVFASVEARYRLAIADAPAHVSVFADAGRASRVHPADGTPRSVSLSSVGVGFSILPRKWLAAQIAAALPTGEVRDIDGHEHGRIWASLSATF